MKLHAIDLRDIPIEEPLPWPLFDRGGHLVFRQGGRIPDRNALREAARHGLFRDINWLDAPAHLAAGWVEPEMDVTAPVADTFPPHGIKPQTWDRLQLRLLRRDVKNNYFAHFIGYIKDQSLLTTIPAIGGQRLILVEGEEVEVRMLTGQNIYLFDTVVTRVCLSPSPYMHLEYPAQMVRQVLRQSPWARVNLAVFVTTAAGERVSGILANLSSAGAQLNAPAALGGQGDHLALEFSLAIDDMKTDLSLAAVIHRVGRARGEEMLEYGIEFKPLPPADSLWLKCLVYARIAEGYLI